MNIRRYKKNSEVTYALGATVVMEYLLNATSLVQAIIIHPDFNSVDTKERIISICKLHNIEYVIEAKPFNIISSKENVYVIGVIRKKTMSIKDASHVVLVNPSNQGNLGTIIRSSLGFGIKDIAIIGTSCDYYDPKTIRASMGAISRVLIESFNTIEEYISRFPNNNLYPFMLDGSSELNKTLINKPFSLIMGNEATGLPEYYKTIGNPIRIVHTSEIDSLNLPIALSIGLYEATRQ